jgi:hypothetical protein
VFRRLRDQVFENGELRVRVVGMPYSPNRTLEELQAIRKQPGDSFLIAVVHQLAGENPSAKVEQFFGEPVFRYESLVTPEGPDCWMFGHWHKDQGVIEVNGRQFVNLGAVSRGALVSENLQRVPKVALLEIAPQGIRVTPCPLTVLPSELVFDLDRKERIERESRSIDQFILRLQQDAKVDSAASIEDNIAALGFAQEVRDAALSYLEQARAEVG